MNDIKNVKSKVLSYVAENTFVNKDKVTPEILIFKEGMIDSMGLVMLITFLEETFGIKTSDADMVEENFESINAISDYVLKKSA